MTITVTDVPERERFEARDDAGVLVGMLTYQLSGAIIVYTHTQIEPSFAEEEVGALLARAAMDDARSKSRTVVPICPWLSEWLGRNPEYGKVVARSTRKLK